MPIGVVAALFNALSSRYSDKRGVWVYGERASKLLDAFLVKHWTSLVRE